MPNYTVNIEWFSVIHFVLTGFKFYGQPGQIYWPVADVNTIIEHDCGLIKGLKGTKMYTHVYIHVECLYKLFNGQNQSQWLSTA